MSFYTAYEINHFFNPKNYSNFKKELWTRYKSSMDCYMYMCKLKDYICYGIIDKRLYDNFYWELGNPIDKAPQTNPDTRPRAT